MIVCEEMQKLRKMLDEKGIEWHEFPRFEGEVQPEEELPFK